MAHPVHATAFCLIFLSHAKIHDYTVVAVPQNVAVYHEVH